MPANGTSARTTLAPSDFGERTAYRHITATIPRAANADRMASRRSTAWSVFISLRVSAVRFSNARRTAGEEGRVDDFRSISVTSDCFRSGRSFSNCWAANSDVT